MPIGLHGKEGVDGSSPSEGLEIASDDDGVELPFA